jgi:hypothetical protein
MCGQPLHGMHADLRAMAPLRGLLAVLLALSCAGMRRVARAEEPDPRRYLMAQPTEYTDVLDAFEDGGLLDVAVSLGFVRSANSASIQREIQLPDDRIAGRYEKVASSRQVTNALSLELGLGVYEDLMVYARLPLVLSDTRVLRQPGKSVSADVQRALGATANGGPPLFDGNYTSVTRSGVGAVDLGVAWGAVNQYRMPYLPTWVVSAELRVGFGELLQPCSSGAACGNGVNRGTARATVSSRWSYRWRWAEPYLGLRYALEWATGASERFAPHGDRPAYVDATPPSVAETTLGAALVAWEDRGRYQRLSIDVRGSAAYVSAGRDYSVLFDALGSSSDAQLTQAYASAAGPVSFNGLTEVASHVRLGSELALAMQAARYVRFRLGISLWHATAHLLTGAAPCSSGNDGSCAGVAANPLYRPVIDLPGQRFQLASDLTFDLLASATGQF